MTYDAYLTTYYGLEASTGVDIKPLLKDATADTKLFLRPLHQKTALKLVGETACQAPTQLPAHPGSEPLHCVMVHLRPPSFEILYIDAVSTMLSRP